MAAEQYHFRFEVFSDGRNSHNVKKTTYKNSPEEAMDEALRVINLDQYGITRQNIFYQRLKLEDGFQVFEFKKDDLLFLLTLKRL